jgi:hypothetical protein
LRHFQLAVQRGDVQRRIAQVVLFVDQLGVTLEQSLDLLHVAFAGRVVDGVGVGKAGAGKRCGHEGSESGSLQEAGSAKFCNRLHGSSKERTSLTNSGGER